MDGDPHSIAASFIGHLVVDPNHVHYLGDRSSDIGHGTVNNAGTLLRHSGENSPNDLEFLHRLGPPNLLVHVGLETPSALPQGQGDFANNLRDGCDGLLRLRSEGDLGGTHVDEYDGGTVRNPLAPALLQTIPSPVHRLDGLSAGTRSLLVEKWHSVGIPQDLHRLVRGQVAAVHDAHLGLEWMTFVNRWGSGDGRTVKLWPERACDIS